jgi:hypothetical protein
MMSTTEPTTKTPLFGRLRVSRGHWIQGRMGHGPRRWPWWRLLSVRIYRLAVCPPTTGFVIWFYMRRGAASIQVVFDRRRLMQPELYS